MKMKNSTAAIIGLFCSVSWVGCGNVRHVLVPISVPYFENGSGSMNRFGVFERRTLSNQEPAHYYLGEEDHGHLRFEYEGRRIADFVETDFCFVDTIWATPDHLYIWTSHSLQSGGRAEEQMEIVSRIDSNGNLAICIDITHLQDEARTLRFNGYVEPGTLLLTNLGTAGEVNPSEIRFSGLDCRILWRPGSTQSVVLETLPWESESKLVPGALPPQPSAPEKTKLTK